jgi:hypothetical protein
LLARVRYSKLSTPCSPTERRKELIMETAEDFVCRIADDVGCEPDELASVIAMVNADRSAAKLEALDELAAAVRRHGSDGMRPADSYITSMSELLAKYTKAGGAG